MHITYSKHARQHMRERNVSGQDVYHVMATLIAQRNSQHPSAKKRITRGNTLRGTRVEVVYTEGISQNFHIVIVKVL